MEREEIERELKGWLEQPGCEIFVKILKNCRQDHLEGMADAFSPNKDNTDISYIMGQCAVIKTITSLFKEKSEEDIKNNLNHYYFQDESK